MSQIWILCISLDGNVIQYYVQMLHKPKSNTFGPCLSFPCDIKSSWIKPKSQNNVCLDIFPWPNCCILLATSDKGGRGQILPHFAACTFSICSSQNLIPNSGHQPLNIRQQKMLFLLSKNKHIGNETWSTTIITNIFCTSLLFARLYV